MKVDLNKFTKEELIRWIEQNHFGRPPKEHELLFIGWELAMKDYQQGIVELDEFFKSIDFRERDNLGKAFNESNDLEEKRLIVYQIEKYDKKFKEYLERAEKLRLQYEKIQKLYDSIDVARQGG